MGEPVGRSPRQVAIADHLWEAFDHMSRDMGVDRDALVNQALFAFARQNGYVAARGPGEPASVPPTAPASFGSVPAGRVAPIPVPGPGPVVPAPNPFAAIPPPAAAPRAAPIPMPAPIPAIPSPVAAAPSAPPPANHIPAPATFDPLAELKLDLPSRPASQPPPVSLPAAAHEFSPAADLGAALDGNDENDEDAGSAPTADGPGISGPVLILYAEGRELDRVSGQRFLIGRGKHCDLIINSGKVSREHAAIIREGSDFYIEDLGSSNGTWFDKKRITRRQIGDGDEYFVCSEKITCHLSLIHSMYPWLVDGVLILALVPAFIWDVRVRRIPHWITLPTIAIGLLLAGHFWGLGDGWARPGLRSSFAAGAGAYLFFVVPTYFGLMGGGDTNLMAAIGTLLGFPAILLATVCISIVGGIQGILTVLARSSPGRVVCRKLGVSGTDDPEFGRMVPYGVAIVIGTAIFRVWQHIAAGR